IRFGVIADTQKSVKMVHSKLAKIIKPQLPTLNAMIHLGDVVAYGGQKKNWLEYFDVASVYLSDIPQMTVLGNHEYYLSRGSYYNQLPKEFKDYMRGSSDKMPGFVSYDFPQVRFIMLNSNLTKMKRVDQRRQMAWFKEQLEITKKIKKNVIVCLHHSIFTSTHIISPVVNKRLIGKYLPVLESYPHIKLVLSGHQHLYERSEYKGSTYLSLGPAGGIYSNAHRDNKFQRVVAEKASTVTFFTIDSRSIDLVSYDHNNKIIDRHKIML
ncbi:metallophosphoesterase, partial [Bacteriovoracaceae bacterium]|nr:metallophosphoesterase [Bacteriovoracaceae bacterium]